MKKPFKYSIVAIAIAIVLLFSFCLVCRYDVVPVLINKTEASICVITSTSRKLVSDNEEQLKERKNYSQMCVDFHHILLSEIVNSNDVKDKGAVFDTLTSLSLKDGYHLGLKLADWESFGDVSYFIVYNDEGFEDRNIIRYLRLEPTEMAAWQVYLLMTSPTVMPKFWHGNYISRRFVFSQSDLKQIESDKKRDLSDYKDPDILLPSVDLEFDNDTKEYIADVCCCYWNNWEGLVRDHVVIVIKDNSIVSYSQGNKLVLYKYNCGIKY